MAFNLLMWACLILLGAVLFVQFLILRKTGLKPLFQSVESLACSLEQVSQHQKFNIEALQKQVRLLGQDIENRQGHQVQQLQQAFAQMRTESQQAQTGLHQLLVGQLNQGNQQHQQC